MRPELRAPCMHGRYEDCEEPTLPSGWGKCPGGRAAGVDDLDIAAVAEVVKRGLLETVPAQINGRELLAAALGVVDDEAF